MVIFEAQKIVKQFSKHLALNEVSISVPEGSIYGLLGPNGAGKTTLIRIINQITAPDSGFLYFKGKKLKSEHVAQIGYLPEERGLYKKMEVGEQAIYLAQLKGLSKHDAKRKLKYWFEKFEIQAWWSKKVEELSKGMQQKIQFITTILHEPRLLIFDEPFSGFDPINAKLIKEEILKLRNDGSTIIFSTHDMGSVEELCDHISLINNSKTILNGHIKEIREAYKSNIYEISIFGAFNKLKATLSANYVITNYESQDDIHTLIVQITGKETTNDLIKYLMSMGGNIVSFKELVPSMNEIFIKTVNETNLKESSQILN